LIIVHCALGRNGSFGFAAGWLVCQAKPNVPFVLLAKIELKKCAMGKIKNTEGSVYSLSKDRDYYVCIHL
jgi:hypothetical protein